MWGFLRTQKCLCGWGSERSGLWFSKDSLWKSNASNPMAGGGGGDLPCDSQGQNLPAPACLHSDNRTAVPPLNAGQASYFSWINVHPSISVHEIMPLLTSRAGSPRTDVSWYCRIWWPEFYDTCLNVPMGSVVFLADGSSILLIPVHQLLLASCCVNRLHFLRWCIYKRKITDNFPLASPQTCVETKKIFWQSVICAYFLCLLLSVSLVQGRRRVPQALRTTQVAGEVAGSASSWEVDAVLGEQTALVNCRGPERIQHHVCIAELQNPSSRLWRFETCMYLWS